MWVVNMEDDDDDDDLYDDSLLSKRTIPQRLNMSSTSYSRRPGGRLSLGGHKLFSPIKANVSIDFSTAQKEECERCGLPTRLIFGSLESHVASCALVRGKRTIEAMKIQMENNFEVPKETQVDHLAHDKVPKKRRKRRIREETSDLSYVEGGTTTEEDSDNDLLKACPVFKRIPGTSFAVDALCHGEDSSVKAHFLTRFREENCLKRFTVPIYCSPITAALMRGRCEFAEKMLTPLEYDEPRMIAGVKVTAIDAYNEPGSALLLFQLPGNVNILYVGDLRPDATLESQPTFWSPGFVTDYLMVDTSRCKPDTFRLLREDLEDGVKRVVEDCLKKRPKSLVALVSDGLMEKHLLTALALQLNLMVFAHPDSATTLAAVDDPVLNDLMTTRQLDANLQVIPKTSCTYDDLTKRLKLRFSQVIVVNPRKDFKVDGPIDIKPVTDWNVTVIDVPMMDAVSFSDLERLVRFLRPKRLVSSRRPHRDPIQTTYFRKWLNSKDPVVVSIPYKRK